MNTKVKKISDLVMHAHAAALAALQGQISSFKRMKRLLDRSFNHAAHFGFARFSLISIREKSLMMPVDSTTLRNAAVTVTCALEKSVDAALMLQSIVLLRCTLTMASPLENSTRNILVS